MAAVAGRESSESFDYADWAEQEQYSSKRKFTADLDANNSASDSGFHEVPEEVLKQPAKKVKFLHNQKENGFKPIAHFDDSDALDTEEHEVEADPAFSLNAEAYRRYEETLRKSKAEEKTYSIFQLARLNDRKARVSQALQDPDKAAPDEKKAKNLITLQEAGKPPKTEYVDLDTTHVWFLPAKPPDLVDIDEILGPSPPTGTPCFACTHGVGYPMMNGKLVENLEKYVRETLPNTEPIQASIKIAYYYTKNVQAPTNRNLKGEQPLPNWTPRQVFDCFSYHRVEPSFWQYNTLRELRQHRRIIRETGLYNYDSGILSDGRVPTARDIFRSKDAEEAYFKTIDKEIKVFSLDPKKMAGHNEKLSIASSIGTVFAPKVNTFEQQKISDIFSANKK